jgi:putative spermidine/putrescine transport system permease protein
LKIKGQHIALSVYIMVAVLPLFLGLVYAILYSFGGVGALANGFTLKHWTWAFSSNEILDSIGYSVYVAFVAITISACLAMLLVIKYSARLNAGPLSFSIYLPLAIPPAVAAFFSFQLLSGGGFLARLFYQTGIIDSIEAFPDLINDAYGVGIILTHVMLAFPFFTLVYLNIYRSKKVDELAQLAETLGAKTQQIRSKVIIPILIKGGLATNLLFFVFVLGSYEIPLLLGRQSPQMMSILTMRKLERFDLSTIPQAYVIALIYTVMMVSFLGFAYKRKLLKSYAA